MVDILMVCAVVSCVVITISVSTMLFITLADLLENRRKK